MPHLVLRGELLDVPGSSPCPAGPPGGPCRRRRTAPVVPGGTAWPAAAPAGRAGAWPACRWRSGGRSPTVSTAGPGRRSSRPRRWPRSPGPDGIVRRRSRTKLTSRSRPCCRARHSSSSPASSTRAQSAAGAPSHSGQHPAGQQVVQLGRDPRRRVHAVRHRADRHLVGGHVRPQTGEHRPADRAVQLRHPVAPSGQPQPHHRHVEPGLAGLVGAAAEGQSSSKVTPHSAAKP